MKTVLARTTVDQIALLGSATTRPTWPSPISGTGWMAWAGSSACRRDGEIGFAHSTPYLAHAYMHRRHERKSVTGMRAG